MVSATPVLSIFGDHSAALSTVTILTALFCDFQLRYRSDRREEHSFEASSQRILSDPQIHLLLWSGTTSETSVNKTWSPTDRRSAPSARVSGTPIASRDAETNEPQSSTTRGDLCDLPRRVHALQRYRPGPQEPERNGRSVERRSSGQHPGNTLVVQRREGVNQNGMSYGRLAEEQERLLPCNQLGGRCVSAVCLLCHVEEVRFSAK